MPSALLSRQAHGKAMVARSARVSTASTKKFLRVCVADPSPHIFLAALIPRAFYRGTGGSQSWSATQPAPGYEKGHDAQRLGNHFRLTKKNDIAAMNQTRPLSQVRRRCSSRLTSGRGGFRVDEQGRGRSSPPWGCLVSARSYGTFRIDVQQPSMSVDVVFSPARHLRNASLT